MKSTNKTIKKKNEIIISSFYMIYIIHIILLYEFIVCTNVFSDEIQCTYKEYMWHMKHIRSQKVKEGNKKNQNGGYIKIEQNHISFENTTTKNTAWRIYIRGGHEKKIIKNIFFFTLLMEN